MSTTRGISILQWRGFQCRQDHDRTKSGGGGGAESATMRRTGNEKVGLGLQTQKPRQSGESGMLDLRLVDSIQEASSIGSRLQSVNQVLYPPGIY